MNKAAVLFGLAMAGGSLAPTATAPRTLPPKILAIGVTKQAFSWTGGVAVVAMRVQDATRCWFSGTGGVVVTTQVFGCRDGLVKVAIRVPQNLSSIPEAISLLASAANPAQPVSRAAIRIDEGGSLAAIGPSLRQAVVSVPYGAQLQATGGTPPYYWRLVGGSLPAGLQLSSSGAISGVPSQSGLFRALVEVDDASTPQLSVYEALLIVVDPPPALLQPITPEPPARSLSSYNWSGYVLNGSFRGVSGTFVVPHLEASSSLTATSEWVGLGGVRGSGLIQAGVLEVADPNTGAVVVEPWWEVLPLPQNPISLRVEPGDRVSVSLAEETPGEWLIELTDDTTGASFGIVEAYTGDTSTADFVVEAPSTEGAGGVDNLGNYSPPVSFSALKLAGEEASVDVINMVQGGIQVSTPGPLSGQGFVVSYGQLPPSAGL